MPFPPILAGKHPGAPSVFVPEALLREARGRRGLAEGDVPAVCLLDPDGDPSRRLRLSGRSHPCPAPTLVAGVAAALNAFAIARDRHVLCLAHVIDTMGTAGDDFEKGERDGTADAVAVLSAVVERLIAAPDPHGGRNADQTP